MPAWGRRQSYPAVVGTTVALVAVFTATALLRPLIPDPEPNPIVARRGEFMQLATKELVKWRALEDRPFAEAKRTDRLVFMVVGCAWSWTGRQIDKNILIENEVAERLNHDFIPVRVDATFRPEWEFGPIPLTAAATGSDPGWYVLIVRPDGLPVAWLSRSDSRQKIETQTFLDLLTEVQKKKVQATSSMTEGIVPQMDAEAPYLAGNVTDQDGDLDSYAKRVTDLAKTPSLLGLNGIVAWHPWEWRFIMSKGSAGEAQAGLSTLLSTSKVDWLYGGLFRVATEPKAAGVKFDKLAIENADMANVFACLWSQTKNPIILNFARKTFDSVLRNFWKDGEVFSFEYSEDFDQGRNPRISLKPSLLRHKFPNDQRWLMEKLGLDVTSNPSMTIRVQDLTDYDADRNRYEDFFSRIKAILGIHQPMKGGADLVSNIAGISARLTETARILGDETRLHAALDLYPRVESYIAGTDGVVHTLQATPDAIAFLGDYTAMVDAQLQNFLATGNINSLESGRLILIRAKSIFGSSTDGVLGSIPPERTEPETKWVALPNVVDGSQGSLIGAYARLSQAYSLILRDTKSGLELRGNALTTMSRYAPLTKKLQFRIGALAHAMVQITNDQAVFVVGSGAEKTALRLSIGAGEKLVVPAIGNVRVDLQKRGPGIWICSHEKISGPYSERAAQDAMASLP